MGEHNPEVLIGNRRRFLQVAPGMFASGVLMAAGCERQPEGSAWSITPHETPLGPALIHLPFGNDRPGTGLLVLMTKPGLFLDQTNRKHIADIVVEKKLHLLFTATVNQMNAISVLISVGKKEDKKPRGQYNEELPPLDLVHSHLVTIRWVNWKDIFLTWFALRPENTTR